MSRRILFFSTTSRPLLLRITLFLCSLLRLVLPRCFVRRCFLAQFYACIVKWIKTCVPVWRSVHFYVRIYISNSVLHKCIWQLIILETIFANVYVLFFLNIIFIDWYFVHNLWLRIYIHNKLCYQLLCLCTMVYLIKSSTSKHGLLWFCTTLQNNIDNVMKDSRNIAVR